MGVLLGLILGSNWLKSSGHHLEPCLTRRNYSPGVKILKCNKHPVSIFIGIYCVSKQQTEYTKHLGGIQLQTIYHTFYLKKKTTATITIMSILTNRNVFLYPSAFYTDYNLPTQVHLSISVTIKLIYYKY